MEVQQIEMDPAQARERLKAVRTALHRRADEEYEHLAQVYEALGKGLPLIRLSTAIRDGGFHQDGRPRLAIARSDRKQCRVEPNGDRHLRFSTQGTWNARRGIDLQMVVEVSERPKAYFRPGWALVPMIPPEVRNTVRFSDRKTFILWEVEAWADRAIIAEPDLDPLLLRRIHGDLFAVLAHWDLTEVERLAMEGRRFEA